MGGRSQPANGDRELAESADGARVRHLLAFPVMAIVHNHPEPETGMLRRRSQGEHSRVGFFELFFDLVFVFAVTQMSHSLAEHLDLRGAVQTLLLLLAVWWAWIYTTWATNWLNPDHVSVRLMLAGLMLGGLIMSAAIPEAFDGRGVAFAIPYVAIQVGRSFFVVYAMGDDKARRVNFIRIGAWFAISGVVWLAGAAADGDTRLIIWAFALGFEYLGPPMSFWLPGLGRSAVADWNVEGSHLAERCGLFVIIALGESLLVTGATFSGLEWRGAAVAAMVASFVAAVAMWWVYFDVTAEAGSNLIAHSSDPGRIARSAYTYIHLPMVAGIILTAVGDQKILAHPRGATDVEAALAILGGPALFLIGHWLFKRAIVGRLDRAHLAAVVALDVVLAAFSELSPIALTSMASVVLVTLAIHGRTSRRSSLAG